MPFSEAIPVLSISSVNSGVRWMEGGREVAVMAAGEEGYRVEIVSLIRSLCKSQQSQEMPGPWLRLIATAITKEGFL